MPQKCNQWIHHRSHMNQRISKNRTFHGPKTQPIGKLYYKIGIGPFRYHCSGWYCRKSWHDTSDEFPTENISAVIRFLSIRIKVISLNFENAELVQRHRHCAFWKSKSCAKKQCNWLEQWWSFEKYLFTVRVWNHRKSSEPNQFSDFFGVREGDIDVGDLMLKIEKCCEGNRAPPTPQKSENKLRVIWLSMITESNGII